MKSLVVGAAITLAVSSSGFAAAPVSDGSFFLETFTAYPEDPRSQAINVGADPYGFNVRLTTTLSTEGVFRASPLTLGAEYVVEFDYTLHAPSGNNWYVFYAQGDAPPYVSAIALRAIPFDATQWLYQVDYGNGEYEVSSPMNYDELYHFTIHVKPGPTKPVDLYVDGALIGQYASRDSDLTTDLIQWGDPSSVDGYGDATVDNISVGLPGPPQGIPGDFDESEYVDGDDLLQWKLDFGVDGGSDADEDDDSDGNDFLIWQRNFGEGTPPIVSVPEPTAAALGAVALLAAAWLHRPRSRR